MSALELFIFIPSPPSLTGRDRTSRSCSLISRPNNAGMNISLIVSSNGIRFSLISAVLSVLDTTKSGMLSVV